MLLSRWKNRLRFRTRMQIVRLTRRLWDCQIGVKSASSPPRAKSAPRGSKSTTFAKGIFQLFNLQKIGMNPIGDPSVLPTQCPIYLWHQAEAWEAFPIGGWCVVSTIPYFVPLCLNRKFQISKFTVQPQGWGFIWFVFLADVPYHISYPYAWTLNFKFRNL